MCPFQKSIDEQSTVYEKEKVDQAKRIIEPFMLRRLKETVLRDLPTKTMTVEKCVLVPDQRMKYDVLVEDFKIDAAAKDSNCHMIYFMMLRKIANHPLLLRYHFTVRIFRACSLRTFAVPSQPQISTVVVFLCVFLPY